MYVRLDNFGGIIASIKLVMSCTKYSETVHNCVLLTIELFL